MAGAVDKVAFVEGHLVQQGDVLVTSERERYQIAVAQAKSTPPLPDRGECHR